MAQGQGRAEHGAPTSRTLVHSADRSVLTERPRTGSAWPCSWCCRDSRLTSRKASSRAVHGHLALRVSVRVPSFQSDAVQDVPMLLLATQVAFKWEGMRLLSAGRGLRESSTCTLKADLLFQ